LDFRIVIKDINTEALDTLTGELARESAIAPHKVYFDFLKSALTTKAHLNAALRRLPYIPPSAIKLFIFPFVQIMGLTCNVYGMNIIDKKVYTIQKLASFNYPSTNREVKNGGVKALIDAFGLVEVSETI
jgi:molybdopterin/thiamine biosynthesis adenylyltransferase